MSSAERDEMVAAILAEASEHLTKLKRITAVLKSRVDKEITK